MQINSCCWSYLVSASKGFETSNITGFLRSVIFRYYYLPTSLFLENKHSLEIAVSNIEFSEEPPLYFTQQ